MSGSTSKVQKRSKNFTGHEKTQLLQIIQSYANVIENKETDAISIKEKIKCWEDIKNEFNASTIEGFRDVQSLKICYQNTKRSFKKERAEKNKEAYISLLENKLDNRGEEVDENIGEIEREMEETLLHLDTIEKKITKKTGGGSYCPILPTGADAVLGELLVDQLQPLDNNFDDGAQYFGNVENNESKNPSSSIPIRRKKIAKKPASCYFWHITDVHYDAQFSLHGDTRKGCWKGTSSSRTKPAGRYGDYSCDAPWELIESAARAMMSRHGENVEFVLWTGDALSHSAKRHPESRQLELLQNLTELLAQTFSSQFVFPALGHDDPSSRRDLGKMWSRWLPTDSMTTFDSGGYYMIEMKMLKLQIVVLNTNLMKKGENDEEARKQWEWLNAVLHKCQANKETVYLVGHIPPGSDERQRGSNHQAKYAYSDHNNKRYLKLVRKYADIIVGQFFGHLHSDSFRVIYNDRGHPVSWAMLAPAVTPRRTADGANNPGLRLYKFDKDTGQVLDYTQYYLDLPLANTNSKAEPEWVVEYNFTSYYGISSITPNALHNLAEKLTQSSPNENPSFNRYYRVNSVKLYSGGVGGCDNNCAHSHYCAITRVDYEEYEHCVKTAASALASSSKGHRYYLVPFYLVISLLISLPLANIV